MRKHMHLDKMTFQMLEDKIREDLKVLSVPDEVKNWIVGYVLGFIDPIFSQLCKDIMALQEKKNERSS